MFFRFLVPGNSSIRHYGSKPLRLTSYATLIGQFPTNPRIHSDKGQMPLLHGKLYLRTVYSIIIAEGFKREQNLPPTSISRQ